jgi:hypothetical protein
MLNYQVAEPRQRTLMHLEEVDGAKWTFWSGMEEFGAVMGRYTPIHFEP